MNFVFQKTAKPNDYRMQSVRTAVILRIVAVSVVFGEKKRTRNVSAERVRGKRTTETKTTGFAIDSFVRIKRYDDNSATV